MTNKETYAQWCEQQEHLPIFMQAWWMDAVCAGKEWDVLLIYSEDLPPRAELPEQTVVAAMPYLIRTKWKMRYILMPQQTQLGGIWLNEQLPLDSTHYAQICAIVSRRLESMGLCYYLQKYVADSPCPREMQALGWKVKEHTTYRLNDLTNLDRVIDNFSKNKKRQLQKALSLHVERSENIEEFYRFHSQCMAEQHKKITYSREFLLVLERKASRLGQSEVLVAKNADGVTCAAAFVVWDKQYMYYLIPCYSPQYKDSGAGALLVLEAIKLAREKGVDFDFEGSDERGTAHHYKQFGSVKTPYFSVEKCWKWWFRVVLFANRLVH